VIRPATPADAAAIQAIYAHHTTHGVGTFEETPPSVEAMAARMADVAARGLPWLVDEHEQRLRGYAYAAPFRLRSAYRYSVENSVYVAPDAQGQGVGKALILAVAGLCRRMGLREMVAVIGDSANVASIAAHRACGFRMVGTADGVGYKHGRFLDVVFMQLSLDNDAAAPAWEGLKL